MELHEDCVVSTTVYHLYERTRVPRLFRLADQGKWEHIPRRVRPRQARFVHAYAPCDTALHRLVRPLVDCQLRSDELSKLEDDDDDATEPSVDLWDDVREIWIEAVQAILDAYPAAPSVPNAFQRTPLHLVATHPTPNEALVRMLESCPHAATCVDGKGQTALHYYCRRSQEVEGSVIQAFLQADPHALDRCDSQGWKPME